LVLVTLMWLVLPSAPHRVRGGRAFDGGLGRRAEKRMI
jgi:hypothetical protein